MQIYVDHCRVLSEPTFPPSSHKVFTEHSYKIHRIRKSDVAWVLFAQNLDTKERVVIKLLCRRKDIRYNFGTVIERQRCQLEGVHWNKIFSQDVYIGLARLCYLDLTQGRIDIGKIIEDKNPTQDMLDPDADYVLLMRKLPKEARLDVLLSAGNPFSLHYHVQSLARFLAYMHTVLKSQTLLPVSEEWGSVEQLKEKLLHNFGFVNQSLMTNKDVKYAIYYKALNETFLFLKDNLLGLWEQSEYQQHFEKRRQGGYIRRCHGDLKARNIWIAPYDTQNETELGKSVSVLDAVDFNPVYSNIDILSDFAMLAVDVHARTDSPALAHFMIEEYLRLTEQQDEVARSVLAYYLVEKAFVGAIVNIIYDNEPNLGWAFLKATKRYMADLQARTPLRPRSDKSLSLRSRR